MDATLESHAQLMYKTSSLIIDEKLTSDRTSAQPPKSHLNSSPLNRGGGIFFLKAGIVSGNTFPK